jgi:hypothetical protein
MLLFAAVDVDLTRSAGKTGAADAGEAITALARAKATIAAVMILLAVLVMAIPIGLARRWREVNGRRRPRMCGKAHGLLPTAPLIDRGGDETIKPSPIGLY